MNCYWINYVDMIAYQKSPRLDNVKYSTNKRLKLHVYMLYITYLACETYLDLSREEATSV
jgi:hypothetical protein